MTRQQLRQAKRRLAKGDFPFPDLKGWLRGYIKRHPECYVQVHPDGRIATNLFDETTQYYSISDFRALLETLKTDEEQARTENMQRERISSNVPRQTRLRVKKAAEALGLSESKFIEQAVETDLKKLDIRVQTHEARRQRDCFKAKMETAETNLAAAEAKIEALQERGFFARLFNRLEL